jgi:hypothetical protein
MEGAGRSSSSSKEERGTFPGVYLKQINGRLVPDITSSLVR